MTPNAEDRPLIDQMRRILFEMKWLLPWGGTSSFSSDGGGWVPSSRPPARLPLVGGLLPHEFWSREWDAARGVVEQERVVMAARADLDAWRYRPKVDVQEETGEELEARLAAKVAEKWSIADVARWGHTTEKLVRKAVVGQRVREAEEIRLRPRADRLAKAAELAAQGLTERNIGFITKLPKTTVRRALGKAA